MNDFSQMFSMITHSNKIPSFTNLFANIVASTPSITLFGVILPFYFQTYFLSMVLAPMCRIQFYEKQMRTLSILLAIVTVIPSFFLVNDSFALHTESRQLFAPEIVLPALLGISYFLGHLYVVRRNAHDVSIINILVYSFFTVFLSLLGTVLSFYIYFIFAIFAAFLTYPYH